MLNPFICCFQVDGYKYFMQCKEEAAVCAREIRHKCVCNTFTQYSRACASQDVVLKWRTDKFCREWLGLLDTFSRLFSPNSIREWDSNHVPRWSQPATQPIELTAQKAGKGRLLLSQINICDIFQKKQHFLFCHCKQLKPPVASKQPISQPSGLLYPGNVYEDFRRGWFFSQPCIRSSV